MTNIEQKIIEEFYSNGFKSDIDGLKIEELESLGVRRLLINVKMDMLGSRRVRLEEIAGKISEREGISLVRILPEM
jgi:hypothetical protein